MNTRVRKKVAKIRASGGDPRQGLNRLDLKIYEMTPEVDYDAIQEVMFGNAAPNTNQPLIEDLKQDIQVDDFDGGESNFIDSGNASIIKPESDSGNATITQPTSNVLDMFRGYSNIQDIERLQEEIDEYRAMVRAESLMIESASKRDDGEETSNAVSHDELQSDTQNDYHQSEVVPVAESHRTVVINNAEELEATVDGVYPEYTLDDIIDLDYDDCDNIDEAITIDETIEIGDTVETYDTIEVDDPVEVNDTIEIDDSDNDEAAMRSDENSTVSQSKSSFTVTPPQGRFEAKEIIKVIITSNDLCK